MDTCYLHHMFFTQQKHYDIGRDARTLHLGNSCLATVFVVWDSGFGANTMCADTQYTMRQRTAFVILFSTIINKTLVLLQVSFIN